MCLEILASDDVASKHYGSISSALALVAQFKVELAPVIRSSGVFMRDADKRRNRSQHSMPSGESLSALLAAMTQSLPAEHVESNHNHKQDSQQNFLPHDID